MAARKLKFKPKPVVGGLIRRTRDKDDLPDCEIKETNSLVQQLASCGAPPVDSNCEVTDKIRAEISYKKLKEEHDVPAIIVSEKPNIDDKIGNTSTYFTPAITHHKQSLTAVKPATIVDTSNNNLTDKHSKDKDLSSACFKIGIVNEKQDIGKEKTDSSDSKHETEKSSKVDLVKPFPRFGRPKCKPILNNLGARIKLSNTTGDDTTAVSKNVTTTVQENSTVTIKDDDVKTVVKEDVARAVKGNIATVVSEDNTSAIKKDVTTTNKQNSIRANERTESIIKCVKKELVGAYSIISEITESFTSLESDEPELFKSSVDNNSQRLHSTDSNISNKRRKSDSFTLPSTEDVFDELTDEIRVTEANLSDEINVKRTNVLGRERNKQSHSKKIEEASDNGAENTNVTGQSNASNKFPISPLKPTSKVLVPKPLPRLTDTGPRRISFQGSDSEEESKRKNSFALIECNKKNIQTKDKKPIKRKRSLGATYSKMGQEILDKFTKKFGKVEPPDKSKLTMLDLIFYNPKSNPMPLNAQPMPITLKKGEKIETNEIIEETLVEEAVDDVETPAMPVPQLKVGPDGQIMLDPKSVLIDTTEVKKNRVELEKSEVVHETTGLARYSTYSKRKHNRHEWSHHETLQFYRALNTIGSDFSLMTQLFPKRSRHELKLKFKREEKSNLKLVDKALTKPAEFDFNTLEEELKRENEEIARLALLKKEAKDLAKKERALKKEDKLKNKNKKRNPIDKLISVRGSAFKDFEEEELKNLMPRPTKRKGSKKQRKKRKKQNNEIIIESDSDGLEIDTESDDELKEGLKILNMVKTKTLGRIPKPSAKLEEYEEMNETLKHKLQQDSDYEEDDRYTPNGPSADMLFGSPQRLPEQEEDEQNQWNIEIQSVPAVKEVVLPCDGIEEVSELSELGSFGQNDTVLDLSMPLRQNIEEDKPDTSLLNRRIISQSIQIIDQLTSNVDSASDFEQESYNQVVSDVLKNQAAESQTPLPGFESVNPSRSVVIYSVETPYEILNNAKTNIADRSNCNTTKEECILGE